MNANSLRVATIGNGFIAEEFIDALKEVDGASLEAIYIREEDKDSSFVKKAAVKKVYDNVEKMLEDDEINCIYIALPNALHYYRAKQALMAGKHIIVEKPFVPDAKEARELLELAKQKRLFLFEAMSILYMPNYQYLKSHINDLGNICLVVGNYSQQSSKYDKLIQGEHINVFDPRFAGGTLMDLNCYNIAPTIDLFGKPDKIHFAARKHHNGIDLSGVVTMEYTSFNAVCIGAKDCNGANYFQVQGDKGYLYVKDGINGVPSIDICINGKTEHVDLQKESNRLYYEIAAFTDIIRNNDFDACYDSIKRSIAVLEIIQECLAQIDIIYQSVQAGTISV